MSTHARTSFGLLVVLFIVASLYVVGVQPTPVVVTEAFPVGLLAGAWLLLPRRHWRWLLVGSFTIATGVYLVNGREIAVALGWAFAATTGAAITALGVSQGPRQRSVLLTEEDLATFIGRSFLGALIAGGIAAVVSDLTGQSLWWIALAGVTTAHFATYLVLLPHFMGRPRFPGVASLRARVIQWVCTVGCTIFVFMPLDLGPAMAFCIIPFLGWAALCAPMRETLVQLLVVTVMAHAMTVQGLGPFAIDPDSSVVQAELLSIMFAVFICACALVTLPFSLAVGVQRRDSWHSRQEQARVRQLVQSASGVAIIGTDAQGRIDIFNPGAEAIFGYAADEVLGLMPSVFLVQDEIARIADDLGTQPTFVDVAHELASSATESRDVEFVRKDGSPVVLQFSMSRIFNADGKVLGYVSTGEDVTDRVKRQLALEEALEHERAAVENLREVDQVKDALVSGVSHELRTPITSILGYLEMLEDGGFGPLADAQNKALARVKGNSNRLLSLIDDLLMLSRIQNGYLALDLVPTDVRDVVVAAQKEMAPALLSAGLEFTVEVPDETVCVQGDGDRLQRVLVNLLGNAIKFTDRFGAVAMSLEVEGDEAVLKVRDSGIGIPDDEQDQLFERFFRASSARERAIQGSGLGLSIVSALVQSHDGRIEVHSQVDVGTTFIVRLPLESAASTPASTPFSAAHGGTGAGSVAREIAGLTRRP